MDKRCLFLSSFFSGVSTSGQWLEFTKGGVFEGGYPVLMFTTKNLEKPFDGRMKNDMQQLYYKGKVTGEEEGVNRSV